MPTDDNDKKGKLLELVHSAVQHDNELREKLQIAEKFRFIRDRLKALQTRVEESMITMKEEATQKENVMQENEVLVYVHLFNAQGLVVQTWQKMLTSAVFYEYSVNRPIYADKGHMDAFIRSRSNKVQHGFLTIAMKPDDIYKPGDEELKDAIGGPLVKIKDGSLKIDRLISFTHNGIDYVLDEDGLLVKKES